MWSAVEESQQSKAHCGIDNLETGERKEKKKWMVYTRVSREGYTTCYKR